MANQYDDQLHSNSSSKEHDKNENVIEIPKEQISMVPVFGEQKSKWEAMRLKKHFTVQTNLLLKPNKTTYVGAFNVSTELRTIKRSPISCKFL